MKCIIKVTRSASDQKILEPATLNDEAAFEKLRLGSQYKADIRKARNPEFHRKGFALIKLIFDSQERYKDIEDLRTELKLKAGWYTEHVRSTLNAILANMSIWCNSLPGPIATKLSHFLDMLEDQARVVYIPKSMSFADMDELEFEDFFGKIIDIAIDDYGLEDAVEFI